ncbi:transcriptional regulator, LuxR family [Parafrankia sp. EAN1pec]|uniref:LuxR family transcriptional regulator n=1 Tax=Parafrankia sp. (strain EAN1pec) TaxID=298653 RepID=UPI00005438DC|nr:transcriptional regulator, LuxR family [Frankia sp. EAN1pec]
MRLSELGFEGLDEFSDEVWRTVARHPYCGVDLLAEWLRRPEPIVQAEMDRLVEAGLVRRVGHQWEPQDPVRVLQARHAMREAALVAERARMADERAQLYRSGLFGDYVAGRRRAGTNAGVQLLARDEIFPRMAELTRRSTQSVRFLLTGPPPPGLGGDVPDLLVPAASRGVRVVSVWTAGAVAAARRRHQGRRLPPIGQIHVLPALPMRAIVWDGSAALVPVRDDDLDDGAFAVVAPTLVRAIADMVTRTQYAAARRGSGEVELDEPATVRRQRALLQLLDSGLDDSRAARELGVSDRTVKRDVAEMCQRFGVLTRFQLGAAAARAGYLPRGAGAGRWDGGPDGGLDAAFDGGLGGGLDGALGGVLGGVRGGALAAGRGGRAAALPAVPAPASPESDPAAATASASSASSSAASAQAAGSSSSVPAAASSGPGAARPVARLGQTGAAGARRGDRAGDRTGDRASGGRGNGMNRTWRP